MCYSGPTARAAFAYRTQMGSRGMTNRNRQIDCCIITLQVQNDKVIELVDLTCVLTVQGVINNCGILWSQQGMATT